MNGSALVKISLRYGAVAGILAVALLISLFYFGRHPFLAAPFLDFRIFLFGVFMFFAMKEFRDYKQQGVLYFWQGLFIGMIVVSAGSLIGTIGLWIFGSSEERFVQGYVEGMTAYLKTFPKEDIERIGVEVYERNLRELPSTNITDLVAIHLVQGVLIGTFVTIILSVILRRINQNP